MRNQDRVVVFDVDGTLVDTNYQHAIAWFRAFRAADVTVPVWRLHRAIGMGGDQLVAHVAGQDVEDEHGDWLRDRWKQEYEKLIDEVVPLPGARELLVAAREQGMRVVLASSGDPDHVSHYLNQLDAKDIIEDWTTSADADRSKPAPDLLVNALEKVGGTESVLVGDSVWDCQAARRAAIPCVAVRTGGFSIEELQDAGAESVFESLPELTLSLSRLPFGVRESSKGTT